MTVKNQDPYEWAQNRIIQLVKKFQSLDIENDNVYTENHGIWSLKKIIALDCYAQKFMEILKNKKFKECIFVDPFCGSGLIEIHKNQPFPGSALISLLPGNKSFDKFYFSDKEKDQVESLEKKLTNLRSNHNIELKVSDFEKRIFEIFDGYPPDRKYWKDRGYLVFLDPFGFNLTWSSMDRILRSGPVDLIITMMTKMIRWNAEMEKNKVQLDAFFGDEKWKDNKSDILGYYCNKICQYGNDERYKTRTIEVRTEKGLYHIIFASQSLGGNNVFKYIKDRIDQVDLKMLTQAYEVTHGKATSITDFFG